MYDEDDRTLAVALNVYRRRSGYSVGYYGTLTNENISQLDVTMKLRMYKSASGEPQLATQLTMPSPDI
jgi:hypothetical protein